MKGLRFFFCLGVLCLGLMANTECDHRDLGRHSHKTCHDQDSDGYCNNEDFWPGYDDDGQIVVTDDNLDGYLARQKNAGGFIINTPVLDQTLISNQTDFTDHDYSLAVMALPLEPYREVKWDNVDGVSLKVFLLNYADFMIPGSVFCPTSKVTASVKAIPDLTALAGLPCECPTAACVPDYCGISDGFGSAAGTFITLTDLGGGWFEINNPDFVDIIAIASAETEYLVISLQSTCTNNYYYGWKPIEIEDAGNHGGSNNLPTLEFFFLR